MMVMEKGPNQHPNDIFDDKSVNDNREDSEEENSDSTEFENEESQLPVEELNELNNKLDELNGWLDNLEKKNDDIQKQLLDLLHTNRKIREELQRSESEPMEETDK